MGRIAVAFYGSFFWLPPSWSGNVACVISFADIEMNITMYQHPSSKEEEGLGTELQFII